MSHFKAKMHQIRFPASVRPSVCPFLRLFVRSSVRLCLRWSWTLWNFAKYTCTAVRFLAVPMIVNTWPIHFDYVRSAASTERMLRILQHPGLQFPI